MTEIKLPEELEEQAMLHALGILDPGDRRAFMIRLHGESDLLRQAVRDYDATTGALTDIVVPVTPPTSLRERLVGQIAVEAAREAEQFELTANTLALTTVPVKPRDSVRERLLSKIEGHSDVRLDVANPAHVQSDVSARVALSTWLRSCLIAGSNLLRTLVIRSVTSERVRYWKAKIALQHPMKGLTFIKASEGTWRSIAPGVMAKLLSFDPTSRRTTTLLRFAPGTRYAPHRHTEVEELYVLEGGCSIAGREMAIGDYHRAESGTVHHDTSTDDGCVLLVISSPQNEMLQE